MPDADEETDPAPVGLVAAPTARPLLPSSDAAMRQLVEQLSRRLEALEAAAAQQQEVAQARITLLEQRVKVLEGARAAPVSRAAAELYMTAPVPRAGPPAHAPDAAVLQSKAAAGDQGPVDEFIEGISRRLQATQQLLGSL